MANFFSRFFSRFRNTVSRAVSPTLQWLQGSDNLYGKRFSREKARKVHTAYRCDNILSDDIAGLPWQVYKALGERVSPSITPTRNLSYLLEIEPNPYMNPFVFKKTIIRWLINWGAAYAWHKQSRGNDSQLVILPTDRVTVVIDGNKNIWYQVYWEWWEPEFDQENNPAYYPDVEVFKLLINSDDGLTSRGGVLTFARDAIERQLGAADTRGRLYSQGLSLGGIIWVNGELNKDAKNKLRKEYEEVINGSENTGRIAIFDPTVSKFEQITMKPSDAQFLEGINATDVEIANFYGVPIYKLNLGKQSYESNAQLNLDYLKTTLNPYLTQSENEGRRKWLSLEEQILGWYIKFNRDAILATDPAARATYQKDRIYSGELSPNEARQIDDLPPYKGGDRKYMPVNMMAVDGDGALPAPAPNTNGGNNASNTSSPHSNGHGERVGRTGRSSQSSS